LSKKKCDGAYLEESEGTRIKGRGLGQAVQLLDDKVGVANNDTLTIDLLRSGKVVLLSIDKVASLEVVHSHDNIESSVGLDGTKVGRIDELGAGHAVYVGNNTNGGGVARSSDDLLAVGEGEVGNSQAEVDKVVGRGERSNLTSGRNRLAIVVEA
jgi:hypothetical protein